MFGNYRITKDGSIIDIGLAVSSVQLRVGGQWLCIGNESLPILHSLCDWNCYAMLALLAKPNRIPKTSFLLLR